MLWYDVVLCCVSLCRAASRCGVCCCGMSRCMVVYHMVLGCGVRCDVVVCGVLECGGALHSMILCAVL